MKQEVTRALRNKKLNLIQTNDHDDLQIPLLLQKNIFLC